MNRFVKDSIKKIQSKYRKIHRKARDLGLSLPIALLIFLTFFSIITVAVIQTRRDTTFSQAATTCPSGVGTYMQEVGCEQICGENKCKSCTLGSTPKWYCDAPLGSSGYDLPTCSGKSFNLQTACEDELGSCVKCSNDGISVRWHQGTETSTKPETQKCEKTSCKQEDPETYTSGGLIYYGANNLYYSNLSLCQKKDKSGKTLAKICGSTTIPKTSVSPEVSISPKDSPPASEKIICVELNCGQEYVNASTKYILGDHPDGRKAYFKDRSTCEQWGTGYTNKDAICGSQNLLQVGTRMTNRCNEAKTISWLGQSQTVAGNGTSSIVYAKASATVTFFSVTVSGQPPRLSIFRIPGGSGGQTITRTPSANCISKN